MKTTNKSMPLFDQDKKTKPLDGEVSLKDAHIKAALFAAREKNVDKTEKNNGFVSDLVNRCYGF